MTDKETKPSSEKEVLRTSEHTESAQSVKLPSEGIDTPSEKLGLVQKWRLSFVTDELWMIVVNGLKKLFDDEIYKDKRILAERNGDEVWCSLHSKIFGEEE